MPAVQTGPECGTKTAGKRDDTMNFFTKAKLIGRIIQWRTRWDRRDTHEAVTLPDNPKFMGPRDAVGMMADGNVVAVAGLAGTMRASFIYWAMRELFQETAHPRDITIISIGGHGGRGKIPGTLEELGVEGLCTRLITGHTETYKSFLRLADQGSCEVQCIPQGTLALLLGRLVEGEDFIINDTGAGTFVDPRIGRGTPVVGDYPQHVEVVDGRFKYTCPKIDVAVFNAPAADRKGNIYIKNAAMTAETLPITRAAKQNGGKVIANVGCIVEEGYDEIHVPTEDIDAVVVWKDTEQTCGVPHYRHMPWLALNSPMPIEDGVARCGFVNRILGITPRRKPVDDALARLGATVFVENAKVGDYVDIGVGLPEEVSRLLFESGAMNDVTLMNESGVFGGLPMPGIFFGTAANPTEIVSSTEAFERIYKRLDAVILGALEIDSAGNNNVSKRGEGAINYVGPGGFIDLTTCAELVVFCCSWGEGAKIAIENGRMQVLDPGKPKFIGQVDEITFSGVEALKHNKRVFYITHVGAFRLTERGMELIRVMPGIDVQKDIIDVAPMKIVLPESGEVPVADASLLTGEGFKLAFPK